MNGLKAKLNDLLESVDDFEDRLYDQPDEDNLVEYLIDKLDNDIQKSFVKKWISTNSDEFIEDVHDMLSEEIVNNII